jgi:hypothetical protein
MSDDDPVTLAHLQLLYDAAKEDLKKYENVEEYAANQQKTNDHVISSLNKVRKAIEKIYENDSLLTLIYEAPLKHEINVLTSANKELKAECRRLQLEYNKIERKLITQQKKNERIAKQLIK